MAPAPGVPRSAARTERHPLPRALVWGIGYLAAGQLGLLTVLEDHELLSLVSPAAGVGVVWFATGSRRTWPWDTAVLVLAALTLSLQLGAPATQVVLSTLGAVAQMWVFLALMRRRAGDLALFGGERETWRVRHLGWLLAGAALGGLLMAACTTLGQVVTDVPYGHLEGFLVRWGRNVTAMTALGGAGLLIVSARRSPGRAPRPDPAHVAEGVALGLASAVLYLVAFGLLEGYPLTFLLFVATVWVGTRFAPTTTAVHAVLTGSVALWLTLEGRGIFAGIDDVAVRALLAQLFVLVTTATGLLIGLGRAEIAAAELVSDERALLLHDVLAEVSDGIVVIGESGRIHIFNPAGRQLLGLRSRPDQVGPTASYDPVEADGRPLTEDRMPHVRALRGEQVTGEEVRFRPGGESAERILRVNAQVLPSVEGLERRVLVSYHDITADRLHRDALASFAGHVAHDLKNPLTVIEGWTESLADAFEAAPTVDSTLGLSMTRRIETASVRMREFIRELLDYTLARDQSLRPELLDVVALATDVVDLRGDPADPATAPDIRVVGGGVAWADPVLVRIVLDNLVANACKYVAPGVRPCVEVAVTERGYDWLDVSVSDNGIGIPEDERARVFESFHRVEQPGYQGTGLGLAICQRIVERHGGTITVGAAAHGTGSRFGFSLPRRSDVLRAHAPAATPAV